MILKIIVIIICCPVVLLIFYLLGRLLKFLFFREEVDLSDVVFSKDRVRQIEKSDIEQERNFASLEESVTISSFGNQRQLMMNILKKKLGDESVGTISKALNSQDSETSHYAATALRDELGDFRSQTQKKYLEIKAACDNDDNDDNVIKDNGDNKAKRDNKDKPEITFEQCADLVSQIYPMLKQGVFAKNEYNTYADMANEVTHLMDLQFPEQMEEKYFQWIVDILAQTEKHDELKDWCDLISIKYPKSLISYKCQLKYHYVTKDGKGFTELITELEKSKIGIDSEMLEIIRIFR